jgi:prepilin-type N-terminal cleavage/methylation domain-containing protein
VLLPPFLPEDRSTIEDAGVHAMFRRSRKPGVSGRRRGFTLIEMVVGSSVMVVVMLAIGGTIHLMTRGVASLEASAQLNADAALVTARVRRELGSAFGFTELTSKRVTFLHPDVTGDGLDDTITYDWAGATGAPLQRSVNGGTAVVIAEGVTEWSLTCHTNLRTISGGSSTNAGQVILAQLGCPNPGFSGSCQPTSIGLASTTWRGEKFTLASSTPGTYSITTIAIYLYRYANAPTGTLYVRFVDFDGAAVLEEETLPLASIATSQWGRYEFSFTNLGNLQFGRDYGICVGTNTSSTAAYIARFDYTQGAPTDGMCYMDSYDGWYWTLRTDIDLKFVALGSFQANGGTTSQEYVTHFATHLRLSDGTRSAVIDSGVPCANRPSAAGLPTGS